MPAAANPLSKVGALVFAYSMLAASASPQETRATIFGSGRDASGGVLPGASVVVTNVETNVSNETVTNERGAFEIPYLIPGWYRIAVSVDGFKKDDRRINGLFRSVALECMKSLPPTRSMSAEPRTGVLDIMLGLPSSGGDP